MTLYYESTIGNLALWSKPSYFIIRIALRLIYFIHEKRDYRERPRIMIIKHYFLNELEREICEQKLLKQDPALDETAILEMDDRELVEMDKSK